MDKTVIKLVSEYVLNHIDKSDKIPEFEEMFNQIKR